MTRAHHIAVLQMEYALAMEKRELKKAGIAHARLSALMQREIEIETEMDRKAS